MALSKPQKQILSKVGSQILCVLDRVASQDGVAIYKTRSTKVETLR